MTLFILLVLIKPELAEKLTPPCLLSSIFNFDYCWGCGITRAFFSMLKGNFLEALNYNKFIFVVAPILSWVYLKFVYKILSTREAK